MNQNIIFLLIAFVFLITTSTTIHENFSTRHFIRRRITKPITRHMNSKIDAFKNRITRFQDNYL